MLKINFMSTLFVGIDVSLKSNQVYAMDFFQNKLLNASFSNNEPGSNQLTEQILNCLNIHKNLNTVMIALESTSVYSIHIANHLSACEQLMAYKTYVYCINPKMTANYRKSFIGMPKTDFCDAFVIADFARVGRIRTAPWTGSQYLALQRLTRHRLHLAESVTREKTYMIANLYLKFSQLQLLDRKQQPFSDLFGASSSAIMTEYLSLEEIICSSEEDLISFIAQKSRNRITDISKTAELLKQAAKDSYKPDQNLYEPLNACLSSSFNCLEVYKKEIKKLDTAIERTVTELNSDAFRNLQSIRGIGPVFAAGIIAEIGDISAFHSSDALAKYAGLTWSRNQSGSFEAEETSLTKSGNRYLRYYLGEAANSVRRYMPEYNKYYTKKYKEVSKHQHKRALALTSRKFVRLVYGLLAKNRLYTSPKLDNSI